MDISNRKGNKDKVVNFRIDRQTKMEAQQIAAKLGVSLSLVLYGILKQLIRDKELSLAMDSDKLSEYYSNLALSAFQEEKRMKLQRSRRELMDFFRNHGYDE